jgi:hypothetical protein
VLKSTKTLIAYDVNNKLKPVEENEFLLYEVHLLIDAGKFDEAVTLLETQRRFVHSSLRSKISDQIGFHEAYHTICVQAKNKVLAEQHIRYSSHIQIPAN